MRTLKDILKVFAAHIEDGKAEKVEALTTAAAASDLNAVEFSDEDFDKLKGVFQGLMTREAALANQDIVNAVFEENQPRVMNQALYKVEKRLKDLGKKIGVELDDKMKWADMLGELESKVEAMESASGKSEETVKLIASLKADKEDLSQQLIKKQQEFDNQIAAREQEFEGQTVRREFNLRSKDRNWAEHYREGVVNEALVDKVWDKVSKKAILKLKDGKLVPFQKDNPDKELYIGNKMATFEDLVDPEFEPYEKKSEGTPAGARSPMSGADSNTATRTQAQDRVEQMRQVHTQA